MSTSEISRGAAPTEESPSKTAADDFVISRILGLVSLGSAVLGIVAVIANEVSDTQRLISSQMGYFIGLFGLLGLQLYAFRDSNIEIRRLYGGFGALLTLIGLVTLLIPGKGAPAAVATMGYYFLPYGALALLVGLGYLAAFVNHEKALKVREWGEVVLLGTGALLTVASVVTGMADPSMLVRNGFAMALIGLGYMAVYLSLVDASIGYGYQAAVGLGVLGTLAVVYALGRSIAPTLLYEGPTALRNPNQTLDMWKVLGRAAMIALGLGGLLIARSKSYSTYARVAAGVIGLATAALFFLACFSTNLVPTRPTTYLVPGGLILAACGLLCLAVAIGACSDSPIVVLTRKELSSYFYSPIGYVVLFGATLISGIFYRIFIGDIFQAQSIAEPIVRYYHPFGYGGAMSCLFMVPAITMRLFSEERRTGTLEMLLTAPVTDFAVVISKFIAAMLFFMIFWIPGAVFLVALRVAAGQPFEYLPVLAFFLALVSSSAAFLSMGMFFSSLTKNQIVAGVFTFAGMTLLLFTYARAFFSNLLGDPSTAMVANILAKLDFLGFWTTALNGQLSITNVVVQLSICVFWLFLTLKVLESRKWS